MRSFVRFFISTALILCGLLSIPSQQAWADLSVLPTHIVFEGRDRFASVTLINTSKEQKTYDMGWRYFTMQERGPAYKPSDSATTEFDLSKHIVFSPRRVTLSPGGKQKIRLALRRPEDVPIGDYRAHFEFAPVVETAVTENEIVEKPSAGITIRVGYTIPVILRVGTPDVGLDIGDVTIDTNPKTGNLTATIPVQRSGGPFGVLGHLLVYYTGPSGEEELVAQLSNANIFPEIDLRILDLALSKDRLEEGSLRVVIKDIDDKGTIYAERVFPMRR